MCNRSALVGRALRGLLRGGQGLLCRGRGLLRGQRRLSIEPLASRLPCAADAAPDGACMATEFIYELNRVRYAPQAYSVTAARPSEWETVGPQPPLAIDARLVAAAQSHAEAMAAGDFFSHRDPATGSEPNHRVRQFGYELSEELDDDGNSVELIAAGQDLDDADAVLGELLDDLADSERSRRNHLLGADAALGDATEIGVAVAAAPDSSLGNYWAIEVARRHVTDLFVTGVVFDDADRDGRFDAGEGIGGVTISSGALSTTTDATGAYSLPVRAGVHRVIASGGDRAAPIEQLVRIDDQNVQVDFLHDQPPQTNFRRRSLWTHPTRHLDTNGNGVVQPLDALLLINRLNRNESGPLPEVPPAEPPAFFDTNGDGILSPIDALLVINHLNRQASSGEGEATLHFDSRTGEP